MRKSKIIELLMNYKTNTMGFKWIPIDSIPKKENILSIQKRLYALGLASEIQSDGRESYLQIKKNIFSGRSVLYFK